METARIKYSVVVPIYDESDVIKKLHQEITRVMAGLGALYEIIFIDDGSRDQTFKILRELKPIKIIRFRKNFGQTAALDAGIKAAKGEIIITMDGDGQNPSSEIPKLLAKLEEGYDCVSGWRWPRHDPWTKRFLSKGADCLRGFLVKDQIHDSGCTLKAYRRECFEDLDLYGEIHRFIPAILKWQGFKIGEVKVAHRERQGGKSKYSWKRVVKGFLDMWSVWFWRKYAARPLHLFGGLGILASGIGIILLIYLTIGRLLGLFTLTNRIWPLVGIFLVLVGLQLFVSGILADVLAKTYYHHHKSYKIKEIIENK